MYISNIARIFCCKRVDEDKTIKISDFGLCRDVYVSDYYRLSRSSKVPVKWMPPESLHDGMYSHQSDVVSVVIRNKDVKKLAIYCMCV